MFERAEVVRLSPPNEDQQEATSRGPMERSVHGFRQN